MKTATWSIVAFAIIAAACAPTLKQSLVDATYTEAPRPVREHDLRFAVDAVVVPSVVVGYSEPGAVGACLRGLAGDAAFVRKLRTHGACVAARGRAAACVDSNPLFRGGSPAAGAATPDAAAGDGSGAAAVAPSGGSLELSCPVPPRGFRDRVRLAVGLVEAAERAEHLGSSTVGTPKPAEDLDEALSAALAHAGALLATSADAEADPVAPSLALGGDADEAAFASGYLYGLLWLRERALLYANDEARSAIEGYRFGSVVAAGMGSLTALSIDLYFTVEEPTKEQATALDACIRDGGGPVTALPERRFQDCALARIQSDFAHDEANLVCVRAGRPGDVLAPGFDGVVEFSPAERGWVRPLVTTFGGAIARNPLVRATVAVERSGETTVALDERACLGEKMPTSDCLTEGVMSSFGTRTLFSSRARAFSGFSGPSGEPGRWIGGSGVGAASVRASAFTDGPVLTVAGTPRRTLPELRLARLESTERSLRFCEIAERLGQSCASSDASRSRNFVVFRPSVLEPERLEQSGHLFDPVVMRGLFLSGKRAFFRGRSKALSHLGWCTLDAMVGDRVSCPGAAKSAALTADLQAHQKAVDDEIALLDEFSRDDRWNAHVAERRGHLRQDLKACE